MLIESTLAWQQAVTRAVLNHELENQQAATCTKWAVTSAKPIGRKEAVQMLGPTFLHMEAVGILPDTLTVCDALDVDGDKSSLGAPDGVLSLDTGELLPSAEARRRFVTRSLPDPFDATAKHPFIDGLVAHLEEPDRRHLLSAMGYALRGMPSKRWYPLVGKKDGGKSTLQEAAKAALGDVGNGGYAVTIDIRALLKPRWQSAPNAHTSGLIGLQDARLAFCGEPDAGAKFNSELLKDLTGGASMPLRDVKEKAGPGRPIRATIFCAMNEGRAAALGMDDDALASRTKLLSYPKLPYAQLDPTRMDQVATYSSARQAMVAMLVKACGAQPPEDTPGMRDLWTAQRDESIGEVGQWLQARLRVTKDPRHSIPLDTVLKRLSEDLGGWDDRERIEGRDRRAILALAREVVPDLPKGVKTRHRGYEWRGVQLLTESEAALQSGQEEGTCKEIRKGVLCGKPTRNKAANRCDDCAEQMWDDLLPPSGPATGGDAPGPAPSQGPLNAGLQVRIDAIEQELQAMRSEGVSYAEAMQLILKGENGLQAMGPTQPDKFALLMLKRNGLQALRDAQPDKLVIRELLDLWNGAAGFVSMIESAIEASPGVMWESFDWPPVLRGASVLVQEQVKREREGVLQQAQEWLRQRLLQPSLLPGDGSPA